MIEGLDQVLEGSGLPGLTELRELLQELIGGRDGAGHFIGQDPLQPRAQRVFRLRFDANGQTRSVVIKRLKPEIARRNELVAKRWLPAIGLSETGPPLLGSVAARSGGCVWHVYEDLGQGELDPREPDRERVQAAVELIAQMHTQFAGHALLGEVRLHGGDLGIHFYESNVRDAIYALEALRPSTLNSQPSTSQVRDRLLERLHKLRDELRRCCTAICGPLTSLSSRRTTGCARALLIGITRRSVPPAMICPRSCCVSRRRIGRGCSNFTGRRSRAPAGVCQPNAG